MIYRVTVWTTGSVQPGGGTYWQREVVYCGTSLTEARVAFLREEVGDFGGSPGNRCRKTLIQAFDQEPDELEDTSVADVKVDAED